MTHHASLRYMECADVDMGLCVSQFSGAPLDDPLTPSFALADSPNSPSSPTRKGEAGKEQCFWCQMLGIIVSYVGYHACTGAVMFVNNGQLGRKYLSPERLRTAGNNHQ